MQGSAWNHRRFWCHPEIIIPKRSLLARLNRKVNHHTFRHGNTHSSTILIGNKADLEEKRAVSYDEAFQFANKNKLDYIESSAFSAANINLVFDTVAKKVLRERLRKESEAIQTPVGGGKKERVDFKDSKKKK